MKTAVIAIFATLTALSANGQSKFDMYSRVRMKMTADSKLKSPRLADSRVSAIVSADGSLDGIPGVTVIATRGNISVVSASQSGLQNLAKCQEVRRISLSREVKPLLDSARPSVGADKSQSGIGLSRPYTGKGVVTGLFDIGLDAGHVNFLNQETGECRIQRIWTFLGDDGTCTEYAGADQIAKFTTDTLTESHATHVLGCMAGSFNGAGGIWADTSTGKINTGSDVKCPFYGIATDADIAAAVGKLYDANILAGVDKVASYAKSEGKPAVINLSLGSLIGPHDGTDEFGEFLDNIGEDAIVCLAAGNDGHNHVSVVKELTDDDNAARTFLWMTPTYNGSGYVSIWSSDAKPFDLQMVVYNMSTDEIAYSYSIDKLTADAVCIANSSIAEEGYITDVMFDKAYQDSYIYVATGYNVPKSRYGALMYFDMTLNTGTNSDGNLVPAIIVTAEPGTTIQMTNESPNVFSARNRKGWSEGDSSLSISDLACGNNVIAVGAYTTRTATMYLDGKTYDYASWGLVDNEICYFSSYGTLLDGRQLPDISGPGSRITSSVSRYWVEADSVGDGDLCARFNTPGTDRPNYWADKQGTSMSCPIVAGGIALWLEADPTLKVTDIKKLLRETSNNDGISTCSNPAQWGSSGRFDVYAGLRKIAESAGVGDIRVDTMPLTIIQTGSTLTFISTDGAGKGIGASIYDMSGRLVRRASTMGDSLTIDMTDAASPGVYVALTTSGQRIKFSIKK